MDTIKAAKETFYNIIVKCMTDRDLLFSLNNVLYKLLRMNDMTTQDLLKDIFEAISHSTLKLFKEIIREFEKLIDLKKKKKIIKFF